MKTFKKSFLTLFLIVFAVTAIAQPRGGRGMAGKTPEERAKFSTEQMTKNLSLNEKQSKEVYQINLDFFKSMGVEGADKSKAVESRSEKLKKVLNAEQFKTHQEHLKQMGKDGSKCNKACKCEKCSKDCSKCSKCKNGGKGCGKHHHGKRK